MTATKSQSLVSEYQQIALRCFTPQTCVANSNGPEVKPTHVRLVNCTATIRVVTACGHYFEQLPHKQSLELRIGDIISVNSTVLVVHPPEHPRRKLLRPVIDPSKLKIYTYHVTDEQVRLQDMDIDEYVAMTAAPMAGCHDTQKNNAAPSLFGDSTAPTPIEAVAINEQRVSETAASIAVESQEPHVLKVADIAASQIDHHVDGAMMFLTEDPTPVDMLPPTPTATRPTTKMDHASPPTRHSRDASENIGSRDARQEDELTVSKQEFNSNHGEDEIPDPAADQNDDQMAKQTHSPSMAELDCAASKNDSSCLPKSSLGMKGSRSSGRSRDKFANATSSSRESSVAFEYMGGDTADASDVETDVDGYESEIPARDNAKQFNVTAHGTPNGFSELEEPVENNSGRGDQSTVQPDKQTDVVDLPGVASKGDAGVVGTTDENAKLDGNPDVGTEGDMITPSKPSRKRKVLADIGNAEILAQGASVRPRKQAKLTAEALLGEDTAVETFKGSPKKLKRPKKLYSPATTELLAKTAPLKKRKRTAKVDKVDESDVEEKIQSRTNKARSPIAAHAAGKKENAAPRVNKQLATPAELESTQDTIELSFDYDNDHDDEEVAAPVPSHKARSKRRAVSKVAEKALSSNEEDQKFVIPKTIKAKANAKVTTTTSKRTYRKSNSRSSLRLGTSPESSTDKLMPTGSKFPIAFASNVDTGALLGKRTFSLLGLSHVKDVFDCDVFVVNHGKITKSPRLLIAVALGKTIVTDKWVERGFKVGQLLQFEDYLANDPDHDAEWGTTLQEAVERYRSGVKPFKGIGILLSTTYEKMLSIETTAGLRSLVKACGATGLLIKSPKKSLSDGTIMIGLDHEKDIAEARKLSCKLYNKDMVSLAVLRGEFDLEDARYLIDTGIESETEQEDKPPQKRKKT